MIPETTSASPDSINILFRLLLAATILVVAANSQGLMAICMQYCASIQGSISYDNCAPWNSYETHQNKTCYNLCVHNCATVYEGSCMTGNGFRCCMKTTPTKTQEFKRTGCNKIYNNLPGWWL
ncbi:Protein CBG01112 [Caenorhabditis briggsae]|uniref:Protein CBG01112 n=1 Tax=Caenorhabditis briggsae TaxID=6238 RepID=A8WPK9_CAEBR|nr:Protein CBG01112 [Caenorhabditis briggsae]CAP22416.1 Protein CBG01112 [Caenorhabditis briggsae]